MLPEYKGTNLKDVKVDTGLFEGMKFSMSVLLVMLPHYMPFVIVVASDPRSRTGEDDKKELLKL